MRHTLVWAWLSVLVLSMQASAQTEPYVAGGQYVTPHIRWAKPLEGGPIKALVIVPRTGARDVWELAQRLSLDHTVFHVRRYNRIGHRDVFGTQRVKYHDDLLYDEQLAKLDAIIEKGRFDLFVLANVAWSSLPMQIVYKIVERVANGAGVVLTNAYISRNPSDPMLNRLLRLQRAGDAMALFGPIPYAGFEEAEAGDKLCGYQRFKAFKQSIWQAIPRDDLTPVSALDRAQPYDLQGALKAYRINKGRFAYLAFPGEGARWQTYSCRPSLIPGIRVNMRNLWHHDYYYALTAKAFLWAAGRTPKARIVSVEPQGGAQPIGARVAVSVTCEATDPSCPVAGRLEVETRDAITGWVESRATRKLTVGGQSAQTVTVDLPGALAGNVFVNVRLLRNGRVVDFGSTYVRVGAGVGLRIRLDKETVERGQSVRGAIEWPEGQAPASVHLVLHDSRGRQWERGDLAVRAGRTPFDLPTDRTRILVHAIRAVARRGQQVVGAATRSFTVRRPRDAYYVTASGGHYATYHMIRRYERVYEWGVDGGRSRKTSTNRAGVSAIAGLDTNPDMPPIKGFLALDPAYMAEVIRTGAINSAVYRAFNQAIYNSTDDSGAWDRFEAASFPRFVGFLKRTYKRIADLNAEWGTTFGSFSAIAPRFVKDAQTSARVPVWSDYLDFTADAFLDAQVRYAATIRAKDPAVAVGCDALHYNHCLPSLYRRLGYMMPYYTLVTAEMARSLAKGPRPVYTGVCMGSYGYYTCPRAAREFFPWHILLSGNNGILFWSFGSGLWNDLVTGHPQLVGWTINEIARIKFSGAGMLVNGSTRGRDGIAILYSETSRRAEACGTRFAKVEHAALNFQEMIEDQGLQYDYVSTECLVEDKVLERGDIRLLILPHVQAMSPAEARAIKAFVRNGGRVWADVEPAMRNRHGRYLADHGLLDDLFGITRTKPPTRVLYGHKVGLPHLRDAVYVRADPAVKLRGGKARVTLRGVPLLVQNRHGRGEALLWNFSASVYGVGARTVRPEYRSEYRQLAPARATRALVAGLLHQAGIRPVHDVRLDGQPAVGVELTRYMLGDARLLAVALKPVVGQTYPVRVQVSLGGAYHLLDIRSGRTWERTDTLDLKMSAFGLVVLSLLSDAPGAVSLDAPKQLGVGGTVEASVRSVSGPKSTVFVFSLLDPAGIGRRDYQRRVLTRTGAVTGRVGLPWNAAPGTWRLRVHNLLTGRAVEQPIEVRKAER